MPARLRDHPKQKLSLQQKVTLIGGLLGRGKTTALDMLLHQALQGDKTTQIANKNILVVTNDLGMEVDNRRIERWHRHITVRHVSSIDCACCEGRDALREALVDSTAFDHIIVEPSGSARITEIRSHFDPSSDIQTIGLLDSSDIVANDPRTTALLASADIIAFSRTERYQQRAIREQITKLFPGEVHFLTDPYKTIEAGMARAGFDASWQTFLTQVAQRTKRQKQSVILGPLQSHPKEVGKARVLPPMTADCLYDLLRNNCERAKGITVIIDPSGKSDTRDFDYACGQLRLGERVPRQEKTSPCAISGSVEQQQRLEVALTQFHSQPPSTPTAIKRITDLICDQTAINPEKLANYNQSALRASLDQATKYFELQKARDNAIQANDLTKAEQIETTMIELGDQMYFDSPMIWLAYKGEAYQGKEASGITPINTWGELLSHASPKGYICTKRLDFLRKAWIARGNPQSIDQSWPAQTLIEDVVGDSRFQAFATNIMFEWLAYERSSLGKWKNY